MYILEHHELGSLFTALQNAGYETIGPTVRDGVIVLDTITSPADLPVGWKDVQAPAHYSLRKAEEQTYFGYVVGPMSWKKFLFPPKVQLFSARKEGKTFDVEPAVNGHSRPLALFGVRPCELSAIRILDDVLLNGVYVDSQYASVREKAFLVAVNCISPGENCFCVSMNTGPAATDGFDMSLTEVCEEGGHHFLLQSGSDRGEAILKQTTYREATAAEQDRAAELLRVSAESIVKSLDTDGLAGLLNDNFEHPQWEDIAKRCLACTNCTMVCPTCFCTTVEDTTDLAGERAERWRRWDSCFTADYTRIAGGNIRMSKRTRYRQWMMHKLAHWHEQFGTSGCVGCGRCITWCPAGIDITREAAVIRETSTL